MPMSQAPVTRQLTRGNALCFIAGIAVCAVILAAYTWFCAVDVDTSRVDGHIHEAISHAELALEDIDRHERYTNERRARVFEEVAERTLALSGDALAAAALERAERYRRTLASRDILSP